MEIPSWMTPVDIAAGITVVVLLLGAIIGSWFAERNLWK